MVIYIGSDHAGYELKEFIKENLNVENVNWQDKGTFSSDSVDYPDFAHAVAQEVSQDNKGLGILVCGSANGVAITANKHQKVRCAIAWTQEIAQLAREHNNANILALPARFISSDDGVRIVKAFLSASFEGGRHGRRVDKMPCI